MLNNRERFLKTMRFESVDHPPLMLPGPWPETLERWHQEGLPQGVDLYEYFDIEPFVRKPIDYHWLFYPLFEEKVLEKTDEFTVMIDKSGVKIKIFNDHVSMPEHIEYPIKGPESMEWLGERLNPHTPGRCDPQWLAKAQQVQQRGEILYANGGMYFGFLNEHMGTEQLLPMYYDAPEFIHQVNELLCRLSEVALETSLPKIKLDYIGYHEDMAYKNGPLISPAMVREFMMPYYKRVIAIARQHQIDLHWLDSDGDIRELIPLWLECGINIFIPLEVAAGMDVVELRAEYGKSVGMIGGFDKRILASDKKAIKAELERIRPVIEGGGYMPDCDHSVPTDVSWENICCYVETLKGMYGI